MSLVNGDGLSAADVAAVTGNNGIGDLQLGIAGINQNIMANQMASMQNAFNMQSQFANCCCENRLDIANLGADIARQLVKDL